MKNEVLDLTIIAFEKNGIITSYIRAFPNLVVQAKDEEDARWKLEALLELHFNRELRRFKDAKYALTKITTNEKV